MKIEKISSPESVQNKVEKSFGNKIYLYIFVVIQFSAFLMPWGIRKLPLSVEYLNFTFYAGFGYMCLIASIISLIFLLFNKVIGLAFNSIVFFVFPIIFFIFQNEKYRVSYGFWIYVLTGFLLFWGSLSAKRVIKKRD